MFSYNFHNLLILSVVILKSQIILRNFAWACGYL